MSLDEFKQTLDQPQPPDGLTPLLQALWHAARDEWHTAHELAQAVNDSNGSWVHAHLHRQEGDLGNAGYWYRRAGRPVATGSIKSEWESIAAALLENDIP